MATLHVHVDESGEFNFSPTGSRYYIFTTVWTYDPVPLSAELTNLRYSIIKAGQGPNLSAFHACDDPEPRRELVIAAMLKHSQWNFASLVIQKNKVNPSVRDPDTFYPKFLAMLLRFVFRGRIHPRTGKVIIYTDTLPFPGKKKITAAEIAIKASCRKDIPPIISFEVCNHRRESNPWIQVADYCCWSVCRKWEHRRTDVYDRLKGKLAALELDITAGGDGAVYY
jgi:Protein of unknown function (DUF3800)